MKKSQTIIITILGLLMVWQTINQLPYSLHPHQDSWGLTDWLINYEGGFVRRGLGGTALLWVNGFTGFPAHYLAIGLSLVAYGGLVWWTMTHAKGHFSPLLLMSCLFLGFPAMQGTVVRKDCLLLLLLITCARILVANRSTGLRWTMINVTASVGLLLHETFGFVALPALALCSHLAIRESIPKRIGYLLPSFICLALVILHHGNSSTALAIHKSWLPLWQSSCPTHTDLAVPFSTIASIGWSLREGTALTKGILQTGIYQPVAWVMVAMTSFILTLRFVRPDKTHDELAKITGLLLLQFGSVLPLFLVGIDYGRWLNLCGMSAVVLYTFGFSAPIPSVLMIRRFAFLDRMLEMIRSIPRTEWLLLFFGIPILWSAVNFIYASPAGRILAEILRFQSGR
jgi:hypothetical protein